MPAGDYCIHIYVQEGSSFELEKEEMVDPLIEITCCGKKKFTKSLEKIPTKSKRSCYWREHIFFEPKHLVSSLYI